MVLPIEAVMANFLSLTQLSHSEEWEAHTGKHCPRPLELNWPLEGNVKQSINKGKGVSTLCKCISTGWIHCKTHSAREPREGSAKIGVVVWCCTDEDLGWVEMLG